VVSHTITFSDTEKYLEMNRVSMSSGISFEILGGLSLGAASQSSIGEMVLLFRIRIGIGKLAVSILIGRKS
jgi:hypothetical protein